jgi:hypothetical protein
LEASDKATRRRGTILAHLLQLENTLPRVSSTKYNSHIQHFSFAHFYAYAPIYSVHYNPRWGIFVNSQVFIYGSRLVQRPLWQTEHSSTVNLGFVSVVPNSGLFFTDNGNSKSQHLRSFVDGDDFL